MELSEIGTQRSLVISESISINEVPDRIRFGNLCTFDILINTITLLPIAVSRASTGSYIGFGQE